MLPIVLQTINYYLKYFKTPKLEDLEIRDETLINKRGAVFVTVYKKGVIRGSTGNIKEIKGNLAEDLIENTIQAIYADSRFEPLKQDEVKDIKIRIDLITNKVILQDKELLMVDPAVNGVIAIKKDYSKMAMILPNINPMLLSGEDLISILESKLEVENFEENDYIIYKVETEVTNNFEGVQPKTPKE